MSQAQTAKGGLFGFGIRDFVIAAVAAAAIQVIGFVLIPLVGHIPIPGIRSMVSAPFSAIFLTIALARIGRPLSILLVYGLCSIVYLMVSPVIPCFVLSAVIVTETMNLIVFRGYATKKARMVSVVTFYTSMTPLGTLWGSLILGGQYQRFLLSLPVLLGSSAVVLILSGLGAMVGEKVVAELRRAGRMP